MTDFILPRSGFFFTNLNRPQYCRRENGVVRFCPPIPGSKSVQWLDPVHDTGVFAASRLLPTLNTVFSPFLTPSVLPLIFNIALLGRSMNQRGCGKLIQPSRSFCPWHSANEKQKLCCCGTEDAHGRFRKYIHTSNWSTGGLLSYNNG